MKLKLDSIINILRKYKLYVIPITVFVIFFFVEKKVFTESDPQIFEFIMEEQQKDASLNNIGNLYSLNTRFRTLKEDSLLFKTIGKFSNKNLIVDGITYRKGKKWVYNNFKYTIIEKNTPTDSLLKFYLDGFEVSWE